MTESLFDGDGSGGDPDTVPVLRGTAEERLQQALKLAYRHLAKRDRTVSEVRANLVKREIDPASIDGAIEELLTLEYLDDARYAQRYVEDRRRLDGWGALRIAKGLQRTGVDSEIVDRALAEDPEAQDETAVAVETLERRLAGHPPDGDRGRQKALRLLATKGFALDTAYGAIRRYEQECAERDRV